MPELDLSRWAVVGPKDETGVGRMGNDLKRALSPINRLVSPSARFHDQKIDTGETNFPHNGSETQWRKALDGLQGIIILEDHDWVHRLIPFAKTMGLRVVTVVLWEWFRWYGTGWKSCDLFICPNRFCEKVLKRLGIKKSVVLTWPLDLDALAPRIIRGPAKRFLHNVGLFEPDDRKATRIVIDAFVQTPLKDVEFIVRVQNKLDRKIPDSRFRIINGHLERHADLYAEGDVAVQPSKCEGLGFLLLEAMASGLPLITTDYPPMNEYVRRKTLLVSTRWGKFPAEQTPYVPQAHFKIPKVDSLVKCIKWCATHDMEPISRENRLWAEVTFNPERVRAAWMNALESALQAAPSN